MIENKYYNHLMLKKLYYYQIKLNLTCIKKRNFKQYFKNTLELVKKWRHDTERGCKKFISDINLGTEFLFIELSALYFNFS